MASLQTPSRNIAFASLSSNYLTIEKIIFRAAGDDTVPFSFLITYYDIVINELTLSSSSLSPFYCTAACG